MDNRKHVDGCPLSDIQYEFASCGCLHAQAEAEALRAEIERLTYDGIHTCHDDCPRLPCVQRREIERLREALIKIADDLGEQFLDWVEEGCEGKDAIRLVSNISQFARAALTETMP
jgi:hypothetical protein